MQIKYIKDADGEDDAVDIPLTNIDISSGKSFNNNADGDINETVGFHPYIEFDPYLELPKSSANVASISGSTEGVSLVNPSVRKYFRNSYDFT